MIQMVKTLGMLILLYSILCCTKDTPEMPEVSTMDSIIQENIIPLPTAEGVRDFDLSSGRRDDVLPLTHNRTWNCSLFVPARTETHLPLCIALHGGNGDSQAASRLMDNLIEPALKDLDMILLAPVGGIWWSEINEQRITELVRLVKEFWPIDTQKIVVLGYSNGGTASTYFPQKYPALFDASIPMAGNFEGSECLPIPTYFIHGSQDENYSASLLQNKVEAQITKDCPVKLDLIPGYGHAGGPLVQQSLRNAALWLLNDIW